MEKYVIFYRLSSGYDKVLVNAESLQDATSIADAFSCKSGAVIIGVCLESMLNIYCHG